MVDPVSLSVSITAGPIVAYVVNNVGPLLKDEFFTAIYSKKELENLSSNLTCIQAVLKSAEERQLEDPFLRAWLANLKDAAYDAADVIDSFQTDVRIREMRRQQVSKFRPRIPFSTLKASYGRKFKKISARVDEITAQKTKFNLVVVADYARDQSHTRRVMADRLTLPYVDECNVFGREGDKEKIIEMLKSDLPNKGSNISIIPIIGMAGLGKTTLSQLVYNDKWVEAHFDLARIWVCVTDDFNWITILRKMMDWYSKMPLPKDLSPELVVSRFRDFLPGKRFLLVLDDVWTSNYDKDWRPLLEQLELGLPGSKIVVTSRNHEIAKIMDVQQPYFLEYLSEEECWSLFKKRAFTNDELSSQLRRDLEKIGRQIVSKCKGLPLAVNAMGGLLRGNVDVSKWERIMNSCLWELDDKNSNSKTPNILPALKLSYDDLSSRLKQCFAYCSIFPKAHDFDKEELVQLWMAEGFIETKGEEEVEEIGMDYFNELLVKSFIQRSDIGNKERYKMHDLIHDLALSVSSPYCCQVKDSKSLSVPENCRYMSLLFHDIELPSLQIFSRSTKLRTLLLLGDHMKKFGLGTLEKIFQSLKYVRVLDLSSSSLLQLPNSIEDLKLLRYLDVSNTEIKELPNSICNLYNLQTLKLLRCLWLFSLPNDFGNLVNLRHLELDDMFWYKCKALPPHMGSLAGLHRFPAFQVGCERGHEIGELKNIKYLAGTLQISGLENAVNASNAKLDQKKRLQELVLQWRKVRDYAQEEAAEATVLEDLRPHSDVRELEIRNYRGNKFPTWMRDGLLENLVSLTLKSCTKCKILNLGKLPRLAALHLKGLEELKSLNVECPVLSRLKISNCPELEKLPEFLPALRVLKIKKCSFLKDLPVAPSVQFMALVDNLCLENWKEALSLVNYQNQRTIPQVVASFSNLLELKIKNCPNLSELPRYFQPQKLEISGCNQLTLLPPTRFAQRLQCLELDTCNDGSLLMKIPNTSSLYSLVISKISNLVSFPKWPPLRGLKALHIHSCEELVCLSEERGTWPSLSSLLLLSIQDCPKLVSLPQEGLPASLACLIVGSSAGLNSLGPKGMLKSLASLKDLYIKDCPLINSFPEDGLPTSLHHLQIQNCPLLTEGCHEGGPEWSKISHIRDLEIDFLPASTTATAPTNKTSSARWYHFSGHGKGK